MIPVKKVPVYGQNLIPDPKALETLRQLCTVCCAKTIIEVGTFLARGSTLVFGKALPSDGKLYCVDNCCVTDPKYYNNPLCQVHLLMSNMIQTPELEKAELLRMTSLEAAETLDVVADLVFIDARHDYKSVSDDIGAWLSHVRLGGILCGDDFDHDGTLRDKGVKKAVIALLPGYKNDGRIWWYQKP
jgi:predicted O-methyltransferase YrrM